MARDSVNAVKMAHKKTILGTISKLRKKKLSYSQIGSKLSLDKAAVYMIHKRKWYPKMPDVEGRILARIQELRK